MSMLVRITKSSGMDYYNCYDYYLCHSLMEHEMCQKCKNYFNDPGKRSSSMREVSYSTMDNIKLANWRTYRFSEHIIYK